MENLRKSICVLFQVILDDLKRGEPVLKAGWREPSALEMSQKGLDELVKLSVIETNLLGEIRLNFRDNNTRRKLGSYKSLFNQIGYFEKNRDMILADKERLEGSRKIVNKFKKVLNQHPTILPFIIAIGIWKMLNASDLSPIVDDVLSEGFSPADWAINSIRATPSLATSMARKVGEITSLNEALEAVKECNLINVNSDVYQTTLDEATFQKIKNIFRWESIESTLTDENIKFLGISWFIIFMLEVNNLLPYVEFSIEIMNLVRDCVEELTGIKWQNLTSNLEKYLIVLENQNISWATNIIFLPEAV